MIKKSSNIDLVQKAIEAFNYPNEAGEKVDDSLLELEDLSKKVKAGTPEEKIISWLLLELGTCLEEEAGVGEATPYSEVRLASKPAELPAIEGFNTKTDSWEKIDPDQE